MTDINDGSEPNEENIEVMDLFAKDADELLIGKQDETEETPSQEPEASASTDAVQAPTIPDKFAGKTAEEIAASYVELEKAFGQRNNELGDLRRITDDILKAQLTPTESGAASTPATSEITSDDLLENPAEVIARVVAESAPVKKLGEQAKENDLNTSLTRFNGAHPDADKIIADPRFQAFVAKNPARMKRWNEADAALDLDTASDILDTYKEVSAVTQPAAEQERKEAQASIKSPAAGASNPGTAPKKPYLSKTELNKLKRTDPDRYERLQPQIIQAYLEKRVR